MSGVQAHHRATARHHGSLLTEADAIILRHCESDLSLDDLAELIGTSKRRLQRAFDEAANTTFRTYVERLCFGTDS